MNIQFSFSYLFLILLILFSISFSLSPAVAQSTSQCRFTIVVPNSSYPSFGSILTGTLTYANAVASIPSVSGYSYYPPIFPPISSLGPHQITAVTGTRTVWSGTAAKPNTFAFISRVAITGVLATPNLVHFQNYQGPYYTYPTHSNDDFGQVLDYGVHNSLEYYLWYNNYIYPYASIPQHFQGAILWQLSGYQLGALAGTYAPYPFPSTTSYASILYPGGSNSSNYNIYDGGYGFPYGDGYGGSGGSFTQFACTETPSSTASHRSSSAIPPTSTASHHLSSATPPPPTSPASSSNDNTVPIAAGATVGGVFIIGIVLTIVICCAKHSLVAAGCACCCLGTAAAASSTSSEDPATLKSAPSSSTNTTLTTAPASPLSSTTNGEEGAGPTPMQIQTVPVYSVNIPSQQYHPQSQYQLSYQPSQQPQYPSMYMQPSLPMQQQYSFPMQQQHSFPMQQQPSFPMQQQVQYPTQFYSTSNVAPVHGQPVSVEMGGVRNVSY